MWRRNSPSWAARGMDEALRYRGGGSDPRHFGARDMLLCAAAVTGMALIGEAASRHQRRLTFFEIALKQWEMSENARVRAYLAGATDQCRLTPCPRWEDFR